MGWHRGRNRQLIYRFDDLAGWTPSLDTILASGLYDCQNIRMEHGKIKTRGGWSQLSTGDNDINGLAFIKQASGSGTLISTDQTTLRKYDYNASSWEQHDSNRGDAKTDFTVINKLDGNDLLVYVDKINQNMVWDLIDEPVELTGKIIVDGEDDETWTPDSGDTVAADTSNYRRGTQGMKLTTAGSNDQCGATVVFAEIAHIANSPDKTADTDDNYNITPFFGGYNGGSAVQYDCAIYINISEAITFDTLRVKAENWRDPSGNCSVRCETHDSGGGQPSGTLIGANATQTAMSIPSDGWWEITLDGSTTYSQPFWVVFSMDSQSPSASQAKGVFLSYSADGTDMYEEDDGGSWSSYPGWAAYIRIWDSSAAQGLDIGSGYDLSDELVMICYIDNISNLDLTVADGRSYLEIKTGVDDSTQTYQFHHLNDDMAFVTGWNEIIFAKDHADVDLSVDAFALADWQNISQIKLAVQDTGTAVNVTFDSLYTRKTSVFDSTGSQERPPKARYCDVSPYGDRVILANTDDSEGEDNAGAQFIYYSESYDIADFGSTNGGWLAFPEGITGIKTQGELVHVFSDSKRWVMKPNYAMSDVTTGALDWFISEADGPGTVSHRTISGGMYQGNHGVFFLAKDGIYFASGVQAVKVSGDIDILFRKKYSSSDLFYADAIDEENWDKSIGMWFEDMYFLSYYAKGDSDNEATVVLDTNSGRWVRDVYSGSVYPICYAIGEDELGLPQLYAGADNGEVYIYRPGRAHDDDGDGTYTAVVADDGNAYQSDFQTHFIGTELLQELDWQTLNIWVKACTTDAMSIKVEIYKIEDYDDTADYAEWEEDPDTAHITITQAFTPNTAFKWHRLRIPLDGTATYPRARAISLKIYDDNDKPCDYYLESLVCEALHDELR